MTKPASSRAQEGRKEEVGVLLDIAVTTWLVWIVSPFSSVRVQVLGVWLGERGVLPTTLWLVMTSTPVSCSIERLRSLKSLGNGSEDRRWAREWMRVTFWLGKMCLISDAISIPTAPVKFVIYVKDA